MSAALPTHASDDREHQRDDAPEGRQLERRRIALRAEEALVRAVPRPGSSSARRAPEYGTYGTRSGSVASCSVGSRKRAQGRRRAGPTTTCDAATSVP